jgi:peroxiredoxin Q/BCP
MCLRVGDPAPEFDLPTADGGRVALSDFRGRAVVLIFLRYLG